MNRLTYYCGMMTDDGYEKYLNSPDGSQKPLLRDYNISLQELQEYESKIEKISVNDPDPQKQGTIIFWGLYILSYIVLAGLFAISEIFEYMLVPILLVYASLGYYLHIRILKKRKEKLFKYLEIIKTPRIEDFWKKHVEWRNSLDDSKYSKIHYVDLEKQINQI